MRTDPRELLAVGIFGARSRLGDRIEQLVRGGRAFSPCIARETVATGAILLGVLAFAGSLAPRLILFEEPVFAQEGQPTFEVASVKPNTSNAHTGYGRPTGGRFSATNTSLKALVGLAYKIPQYEVFGAPGWVESARYDIDARAAEDKIPDDRFRLMLQALLADRFKLAAHTEMRDEPIYTLTIAKAGLKAEKSKEGGCTPFTPGSTPPQPNQPPPCGAMGVGPNFLDGARITSALITRALSDLLGRPVIDKTGYTGAFDLHLRFRMEGVAAWDVGGFGRPNLPANSDESDLPTIFTALQESLGLALQAQRGPVEALVIDHIEKPNEN